MSRLSPELRANLIYEDTTHYAGWLKIILLGALGLTLVIGFSILAVDLAAALTCFGVTILEAVVFSMVFPRRYQIFTDRLRIVLGGPFAFTIPLGNIKTVRLLTGKSLFSGSTLSINFVTNMSAVLEIVRHKGWAVTISPARAESFTEYLNRAIRERAARI